MDYSVDVYKTKIHLQPLPLFDLQDLSSRLSQATPFLQWAFLALCLGFSSPDYPTDHGTDTVQFYTRSAHEAVVRLASEGTATLEVLQALCLLTLNDMAGQYLER